MMRAKIMPDDHAGQGETLEMIREVNPRVRDRYVTVRIEMSLDDAQKLARAAKAYDDALSDAEGAFRFLAQAVKDGVSGYELGCVLALLQRGLTSPEREHDSLLQLHRALTEDLQEAAPHGASAEDMRKVCAERARLGLLEMAASEAVQPAFHTAKPAKIPDAIANAAFLRYLGAIPDGEAAPDGANQKGDCDDDQ